LALEFGKYLFYLHNIWTNLKLMLYLHCQHSLGITDKKSTWQQKALCWNMSENSNYTNYTLTSFINAKLNFRSS